MVKQAEIIALSEIVEVVKGLTYTLKLEIQKLNTLDPLDFGFKVIDNIPPIIKEIKVFDVNNSKLSSKHKITRKNNRYYFEETIYANEDIALGIYTYDQSNDAYNKNGVNKIKLFVDSILIYHFELDELDFSKNKYINAHIDYEEKILNKRKFHRCFRLAK